MKQTIEDPLRLTFPEHKEEEGSGSREVRRNPQSSAARENRMSEGEWGSGCSDSGTTPPN